MWYFKNTMIMKNLNRFFLLLLTVMAFATGCQRNSSIGEGSTPSITETPVVTASDVNALPVTPEVTTIAFEEVDHNFGEVAMGDKAVHRYVFKNTGTAPLIIESVKSSCSCTVGDYTHEPVAPGESGFVETSMEAKSVGVFKKTATVTVNTDPRNHILSFSGEVVE